ncbi:MAG: type IV pilus modification PilV family protein [Planctomycetota bacterium]|jgi:hypothetical protein
MTTRVVPSRAFSLIEVLIASIVLTLGLLGLSALFAGAAVQQQRSSEVTQSVIFKGNIESLIKTRLGRVSNANPIGDNWADLKFKMWDVLVSTNNGTRNQLVGFTEGTGIEAFFAGGLIEDLDINTSPFPPVPIYAPGTQQPITTLPQPLRVAVVPSTLQFSIEHTPAAGGPGVALPENVIYTPDPTRIPPPVNGTTVFYLFSTPGKAPEAFHPTTGEPVLLSSGLPDPDVSYIRVRTDIRNEITQITGFQRGSVFDAAGGSITLFTATYEPVYTSLMSLNDRIQYVPDEKAPGGRRPALGASALARISNDGKNFEVILITYALRPTSALRNDPGDLPFIPPDTTSEIASGTSILREIPVTLGFDFSNERYYLTAAPADEWLLTSGQWVVMSSENGVDGAINPLNPILGANQPSRISRVIDFTPPSGNREIRAYFDLEEDPRYGRYPRSPLDSFGSTVPISVWVVAPSVTSLTSDNSEWTIEPREAVLLPPIPIEN